MPMSPRTYDKINVAYFFWFMVKIASRELKVEQNGLNCDTLILWGEECGGLCDTEV